jgi:hypothetical protein
MPTLESVAPAFAGAFSVDEIQIHLAFPAVEAQAKRIYSSSNVLFNREYTSILKHCLEGIVGELGVNNALLAAGFDSQLNPKEFNKKDPDSYIWDVGTKKDDILKFEVKKLQDGLGLKYFNFNYESNGRSGLDLTTFINQGVHVCDYLILVAVELDDEISEFTVTPQYLIHAKFFKQYINQSNRTNGLSHYVDLDKMIEQGHCIHLPTFIKRG